MIKIHFFVPVISDMSLLLSLKNLSVNSMSVQYLLLVFETQALPSTITTVLLTSLANNMYDHIHFNVVCDEHHKCNFSCALPFWEACGMLRQKLTRSQYIRFLFQVENYCDTILELNPDEGLRFYSLMLVLPIVVGFLRFFSESNPSKDYDGSVTFGVLQKMDVLAEFNPISSLIVADRIKPSELKKNSKYPILKLERVDGNWGEVILASILVKNVTRKLYLPQIYTENLSDRCINKINNDAFELKFLGPQGSSNKYELVQKEKSIKKPQKKVTKKADESDCAETGEEEEEEDVRKKGKKRASPSPSKKTVQKKDSVKKGGKPPPKKKAFHEEDESTDEESKTKYKKAVKKKPVEAFDEFSDSDSD